MAEPIELDGRTLEGGGQLIRIALCLSALTGTPIKIHSIRGNRDGGGGLKAQHLACVNWLAHASNAHVEGAEKGSKTLLFQPGQIEGDLSPAFKKRRLDSGDEVYECRLDIRTAGSTGLALQAILPFILFTRFPRPLPVHVKISGGTNNSGSPSFEYIQHVLLPTLAKIGFPEIKATLGKRGWSHGGSTIGNFTLEIPQRGENISIPGFIHAPPEDQQKSPTSSPPPSLHCIYIAPTSTHSHFQSTLTASLQHHFPSSPEPSVELHPSLHEKRFYCILILTSPNSTHTLATSWLYDRKISPNNLNRAASDLATEVPASLAKEWESGAWVDEHLRDQLVIFQALAKGRSRVWPGREKGEGGLREPSLHARTAEWVCRQILGRECRFDGEGGCEGVGFGFEEEQGLERKMARLKVDD